MFKIFVRAKVVLSIEMIKNVKEMDKHGYMEHHVVISDGIIIKTRRRHRHSATADRPATEPGGFRSTSDVTSGEKQVGM